MISLVSRSEFEVLILPSTRLTYLYKLKLYAFGVQTLVYSMT